MKITACKRLSYSHFCIFCKRPIVFCLFMPSNDVGELRLDVPRTLSQLSIQITSTNLHCATFINSKEKITTARLTALIKRSKFLFAFCVSALFFVGFAWLLVYMFTVCSFSLTLHKALTIPSRSRLWFTGFLSVEQDPT